MIFLGDCMQLPKINGYSPTCSQPCRNELSFIILHHSYPAFLRYYLSGVHLTTVRYIYIYIYIYIYFLCNSILLLFLSTCAFKCVYVWIYVLWEWKFAAGVWVSMHYIFLSSNSNSLRSSLLHPILLVIYFFTLLS